MAFKIRAFIDVLELRVDLSGGVTVEWIDSIIAREDELFRRQEHEKSGE